MKEIIFQGFRYILKDDAKILGLVYETKKDWGVQLKPKVPKENKPEKEVEALFNEIKSSMNKFDMLFLKSSKLIGLKNDENFKDWGNDIFFFSDNSKQFLKKLIKFKESHLLPRKENLHVAKDKPSREVCSSRSKK